MEVKEAGAPSESPKYYTIAKGVALYTGQPGVRYTQISGTAETNIVGKINKIRSYDGIRGFQIEVLTPPEMKGRLIWIRK